jgi:shikimate kinase
MEVLKAQAEARYPTYAQADITVETGDAAHHVSVDQIQRALSAYVEEHAP